MRQDWKSIPYFKKTNAVIRETGSLNEIKRIGTDGDKGLFSSTTFLWNKNKNRDPLRAVNILMRKGMGHTAVSAT